MSQIGHFFAQFELNLQESDNDEGRCKRCWKKIEIDLKLLNCMYYYLEMWWNIRKCQIAQDFTFLLLRDFSTIFYLTWISVQDYRPKEEEPLNQQNNTLEDPEKKLLRTPFLLWVHLSALGYVINKEKSSIAKPEN